MRSCVTQFSILLLACGLLPFLLFAADAPAEGKLQDGFEIDSADWPWWRGPSRNGTAASQPMVPSQFDKDTNVVWKVELPGRGHGSPTLWGTRLFITTADEMSGAQSVHCFNRDTGAEIWSTQVHASQGMKKNKRASLASSSLACDGKRVFACFPNGGKLVATCLSLDGEQIWQREISDYVVHQGYGASPALYQNLVIVSADNKGGGAIAALDRESGNTVWERKRPKEPNYPSPILMHVHGKDQLVMVGCNLVVSYDPLTGETLWETEGATTECVTSTVTDGNLVYTSGGYPRDHMSAVKADGSGELVWENKSRLYVPSLLIRDGYLYGVLDAGIAHCWNASTGEEMWKKRLSGNFSSSPVLVGDKVFISSEAGDFFIFKASPDGYEELAKNKLGDNVYATPTIAGGRIYHRVGHVSERGQRQEVLYCIGE